MPPPVGGPTGADAVNNAGRAPEAQPGTVTHTVPVGGQTLASLAQQFGFGTVNNLPQSIKSLGDPLNAGAQIPIPPHLVRPPNRRTTFETVKAGYPHVTRESLAQANPDITINADGTIVLPEGVEHVRVPRRGPPLEIRTDPDTNERVRGDGPPNQTDPTNALEPNGETGEAGETEERGFWGKLLDALKGIFNSPIFHGLMVGLSLVPGLGQIVAGAAAIVGLTTFIADWIDTGKPDWGMLASTAFYALGAAIPGAGGIASVGGLIGMADTMEKQRTERIAEQNANRPRVDQSGYTSDRHPPRPNETVARDVHSAMKSDENFAAWKTAYEAVVADRDAKRAELDQLPPAERPAAEARIAELDGIINTARASYMQRSQELLFGIQSFAPVRPPSGGRYYVPNANDSISTIAQGLGVSGVDMLQAIRRANNLAPDQELTPGTALYIPTREQAQQLNDNSLAPELGENVDPTRLARLRNGVGVVGLEGDLISVFQAMPLSDAALTSHIERVQSLQSLANITPEFLQSVSWLHSELTREGVSEARQTQIRTALAGAGDAVRAQGLAWVYGINPVPNPIPNEGQPGGLMRAQMDWPSVDAAMPPTFSNEDVDASREIFRKAVRAYNGLADGQRIETNRIIYIPTLAQLNEFRDELAAHPDQTPKVYRHSNPPREVEQNIRSFLDAVDFESGVGSVEDARDVLRTLLRMEAASDAGDAPRETRTPQTEVNV